MTLSLHPLEHQEQETFFKWVESVRIDGQPLLPHVYAIPNGGHRRPAVAGKLKAEGVKSGVPDINVDVPSGVYHGLRLEMKRIGELPSEAQIEQLQARLKMGYQALVAHGFEQARNFTTRYLAASYVVVDRWA